VPRCRQDQNGPPATTREGLRLANAPDQRAEWQSRLATAKANRAQDKPTVPGTIGEELSTNPFLRASDAGIRQQLDMDAASDLEVFTELRKLRG